LILGENYRVELSPTLPEIWAEALKDMSIEQFELACLTHLRASRFFPTVADIRLAGTAEEGDLRQLEAERAWEALQRQVSRWTYEESRGWFYPRHAGGKVEYAPEFSEAIEYAIRQCGGLHSVVYCTTDRFPFLRKDFLAAYMRYTETSGLQMLGKQEARAILGKIMRRLPESSVGKD
jgi:hypothetical protein